ncbi:hypothetical protein [Chitinivorax sp. B]|nr:hypothetical protein [Chitinivorax sp. B]
MADDLPNAEKHLAILDKLCWVTCEEFRELKKKVTEYKNKLQQASQ